MTLQIPFHVILERSITSLGQYLIKNLGHANKYLGQIVFDWCNLIKT